MAADKKWKKAGSDIGGAFSSFGKAVGKTAKVAFTDEENKKDEEGHTEVGNAWRETGKGFGEAGKSIGKAFKGTGDKLAGKEDSEVVVEEASEVKE